MIKKKKQFSYYKNMVSDGLKLEIALTFLILSISILRFDLKLLLIKFNSQQRTLDSSFPITANNTEITLSQLY